MSEPSKEKLREKGVGGSCEDLLNKTVVNGKPEDPPL